MSDLLGRVLLPVADPDDAAATCRALASHDVGSVLALHVIEKGGGAPDKASVEQREEYAADVFEAVREGLPADLQVETELAFGTDVAETIFDAADEFDATAIVITPRGGSRWIRLLTGDVALNLVTKSDRPVVVLPDGQYDGDASDDGGATDDNRSTDGGGSTSGETSDAADAEGDGDGGEGRP